MIQEYPRFMYHKSKDAVIVNDADEKKALGQGWVEHPDQLEKEEAKPKTKIKELDLVGMKVGELKAILIDAGVEAEDLKGLQKDDLIAKIGELK